MKNKIMSVALIAIVFVIVSGFTVNNVPAKKVVLIEFEFDNSNTYTDSEWNDCAGEWIDYVINLQDWGTVVLYDDGSLHQNFHYNYYNSTGVGQTTGKTYHYTGSGNYNINANQGQITVMTQRANMTAQGMGLVSKFKRNVNIVVNANGELVVDYDEFIDECK